MKIIQKEEVNIADVKETNRDMMEIENKVKERKIEFPYERNTEEQENKITEEATNSSLEKSIWAPNKNRYEGKRNIKAKVAAVKVLGNNTEYRKKSLR